MADTSPRATTPKGTRTTPSSRPSGLRLLYSSLAASASVNIGAWLFIGGIARGDEVFQKSFDAEFFVAICFISQFIATVITIIVVDVARPGRGRQMFAAGMIGMGTTAFYVMPLSNASGVMTLFWVLGGMYFGWMVELVAGPFAWMAKALAGEGGRYTKAPS